MFSNHCMQRIGASVLGHFRSLRFGPLAPTVDAGRWATNMRTYPLLTACLILVGCGRQAESDREVLGELKAIRSELASRQGTSVRWAFANKREIETAIFQWSRDKMEEVKTAEALSPEVEEKIRQYEALQTELMHKQMETRGFRLPPRIGAAETPATDKDVEALS